MVIWSKPSDEQRQQVLMQWLLHIVLLYVRIPVSLSQNGPALGGQTGEAEISKVVKAGGFKHFKRATQTPFNIAYEGKA